MLELRSQTAPSVPRGDGRAPRNRLPQRALLALVALTALSALACDGCSPSPDAPSPASDRTGAPGDAASARPAWVADLSSPQYTVKLNPNKAPSLLDAEGRPLLDLGLTFSGDYGQAEGEGGCAATRTCLASHQDTFSGWTYQAREGGVHALTGAYEGPHATARAEWTLRDGEPRARLSVEVTWTSEIYPDREALYLNLMEQGAALARDLRFTRLAMGQTVHTDRWTPHRVVVGQGTRAMHLLAYGLDGLEVESTRHGTTLILELDDARNHPFRPLSGCGADADTPGAIRRLAFDRLARQPGQTLRAEVDVWLGHTWAPLPGRYPNGAEAAVAIIDTHPTGDAKHLSALAWGHSNRNDPRFGNGGWIGHGLTLTKTLSPDTSGFSAPGVGDLARSARDAGLRFAATQAHSDTPGDSVNDDALFEAGLRTFRDVRAATWLDLDPKRQCTAFHAQGWRTRSLTDMLADAGYTTTWSTLLATTTPGSLNMLRPEHPEQRTPFLWDHNRSGRDFALFHAVNLAPPHFQQHLTADALARLVRERGLLIATTHLDTTTPTPGATPLLTSEPDGSVIPSGVLEARLFDLSHIQERGTGWITSPHDLHAWLTATRAVRIEPLADGRLRLTNASNTPLPGYTLIVPGGDYTLKTHPNNNDPNTTAEPPRRLTGGPRKLRDTLAWVDLPAQGHLDISVEDPQGRRIQPLIPVQWNILNDTTAAAP